MAEQPADKVAEYVGLWMRQGAPKKEKSAPSRGKVIKGKAIPANEQVRDIRSLTGEEQGVVIKGEVFGVSSKDTKTGKQLISFSVCDMLSHLDDPARADSIEVKVFRDKERDPDYLKFIVNGAWVKIRGNVTYDRYSGELVLIAQDVMLGKRPERKDEYQWLKRVELRAHTTMSAMDGLIDPEALVKRAAEWGHKAVAITDHGVVQAFPAASRVKVPDGFKVIYGATLYVVDDRTQILTRAPENLRLADAEFVVLDIETTGFSPIGDDIIELGAVRVKGGQITEAFQRFVQPTKPIPEEVKRLTGIDDSVVWGAPIPEVALREFFDFIGDAIVVAHNAEFDYAFLRHHRRKYLGEEFNNPILDTVMLGRALLPDLKSYSLAALSKELKVPLSNHHRADADAKTAAMVLLKLLERLEGVEFVREINNVAADMRIAALPTDQVTVLVTKQAGIKNLYKLISLSHIKYFNRVPRVPRSELERFRDGLILGSATNGGALYKALLRGVPDSELEELASWYDYLEIVPLANLRYLVERGEVTEEQLRDITRKIYVLGKKLGKPVVATSDPHFLDPHHQLFRRILKSGIGFRNDEVDAPLFMRTTEEMLEEFAFLGDEAALEVVVTNTHKVADMIEKVTPVPDKLYAPKLEGSEEQTRALSYAKAKAVYGDPLPEKVKNRLEKELQAIINNGYAVSYYIAHLLVKKSMEMGYLVGSRGSVGSSFVAWAMDISEVNPLPPHYVCHRCHYIEWHDDGKTGSGYDLPDKDCPKCGYPLYGDGQDIPFETFMGFKGDKVPDIDLNFSGEIQNAIQKYSEELLGGPQYVFKAGTISTIADKTAYGMVKHFLEENGIVGVREAHVNYLASGLVGVKRSTGQHPGGMVVCPVGMEIEEVTPVQYPADDKESGVMTTHFDYHSFEQALMKLDILGHDDPTMLKMLQDLMRERYEEYRDFDVRRIPTNDPTVLRLFSKGGNRVLGIPDGELQFDLGTIVLPEMGTPFVRQMLLETSPSSFSDLVRVSGLSHGTDVWTNNAQELIRKGICDLRSCIPTRDEIMVYLMYKGMEPEMAFRIMENVRKGKGLTPEMEEAMIKVGVPNWYIWSCKQIKYMFPKAHAAAYVLSCLRIAWFKVYFPLEFYSVYFTVRGKTVDGNILAAGHEAVIRQMQLIQQKGKAASNKERESLTEYEVADEAFRRGIRFARVDLYRSDARKYLINPDGSLLLPFSSLPGVGEAAAEAIVAARKDGEFLSVDDLRNRARINKTAIEALREHGTLNCLRETNQMTFVF